MEAILVKSAGFIFVILLGFFLKRVGVFKVEDAKVLNKAMLYVTLPAILINAFREFKFDASLFVILMIGFVANIILMIVGRYVGKNSDGKTRAIYMLSLGGYNIGSFSLPFVQNFFPVAGLISVVMFDIGNTLMCAGGTYSFAAMEVAGEKKFSIKALAKNLVQAFPFDLYVSLFVLSLLNFKFPERVYEIATMISGANIVIVMLMLGILFEVNLTKDARKQITTILVLRYAFSTLLSILVYFFTPFDIMAKQIVVLLLFSPITSMTAIFCTKLECDHSVYGTATSLSIPISIAVMVGLLLIWSV